MLYEVITEKREVLIDYNKGILTVKSDLKKLTVRSLPADKCFTLIDGIIKKPYNEL